MTLLYTLFKTCKQIYRKNNVVYSIPTTIDMYMFSDAYPMHIKEIHIVYHYKMKWYSDIKSSLKSLIKFELKSERHPPLMPLYDLLFWANTSHVTQFYLIHDISIQVVFMVAYKKTSMLLPGIVLLFCLIPQSWESWDDQPNMRKAWHSRNSFITVLTVLDTL